MGKKKTTKKTRKKKEKIKYIPVAFNIPDDMITRFVTNTTVQIMDEEFKLSFFEIKPALSFDPADKPPDEVRADCVATVVMTPDRLSRFIGVLQGQLDKYNSRPPKIEE